MAGVSIMPFSSSEARNKSAIMEQHTRHATGPGMPSGRPLCEGEGGWEQQQSATLKAKPTLQSCSYSGGLVSQHVRK